MSQIEFTVLLAIVSSIAWFIYPKKEGQNKMRGVLLSAALILSVVSLFELTVPGNVHYFTMNLSTSSGRLILSAAVLLLLIMNTLDYGQFESDNGKATAGVVVVALNTMVGMVAMAFVAEGIFSSVFVGPMNLQSASLLAFTFLVLCSISTIILILSLCMWRDLSSSKKGKCEVV